MTLQPLASASLEIQLHTITAIAAFLVGVIQLIARKGTPSHRMRGRIWVALMAVTAVSSLFVNTNCVWGPFGPIHLLTLLTLIMLPIGVISARRGNIGRHARIMTFLFIAALLIAGAFTFIPGRIMHDVVFGTTSTHERCWPVDPDQTTLLQTRIPV
ncbi:DUF2306 domain-containing protein [Paracoccus aurantiacus]|uniref:DUF2306 domain-containing protein n=1 Tax=Paracoccus aurantiacus TaxID=2599412 RepID=A0A5C6S911_9RHOB|nr:DUF2306 domain-containing protein [Paracoccus aurantiacus]